MSFYGDIKQVTEKLTREQENEKIEPCPFCGNKNIKIELHRVFIVCCPDCGACVSFSKRNDGDSYYATRNKYNRRVVQ